MFDHDPELSPDLVWLLQSQQVEDGLLARLLVRETYAQFQPFWEALLGDPQEAYKATQETLAAALLKASTFRETQSVRSWLTGLAIQLYRKDHQKQGHKRASDKGLHLGQLSHTSRLAVALRFRLDYAPEEVADFLGEKLPATETRLWAARQLLLGQIGKSSQATGHQAEGDRLAQAFQRAYPTPTPSEVELEVISQEVIERARRRRRRLQRMAYWKEISLISVVILAVLVWMARSHLDAPDTSPTPPVGRAQAGGTPRPTRRLPATPSAHPTGMTPARSNTATLMPTQWTPTPIPEDAFYIVQEGDTLWGIAISLGTSVEALRSLNRLQEEAILQPGQRLLKPGSLLLDTPAPSAMPFENQPSPTLLSNPRSANEILERQGSFPMQSFWMDMHFIYRGPQGYLGEAQTYRIQLWSGPGQLILAGPDQASPARVFKVNLAGDEVGIYIAQPAIGNPWFERSPSETDISQYFQILSDYFYIQVDHWGDQLVNTVLVGSGQVGDRPAYILRQFNLQQRPLRTIWMDKASGLPLQIQVYDPQNPRRVMTEMLVTGMEINPDIPQELFNPQIPWLGGYAKDSHGNPFAPGEDPSPWESTPPPRIDWPYTPAPANLDLTTSPLQFQFGQISSLFPIPNYEASYTAEVFAGEKYLGMARLPNPFFTLCARSPDGERIAFAERKIGTPAEFSMTEPTSGSLHWIDLSDLQTLHTPAEWIRPSSFAFSPDGKQLAVSGVFGYGAAIEGIVLIDLQTDAVRGLDRVLNASSLVWSPDGKQLAYISQSAGPPSNASLVVLDVESSKVVSRQSFPAPADPPAQNVLTQPPLQWGVPFPVGMGDLGACAAPPGGK